MHITFLGTGAADWRPEDPYFRAFSSILVDQKMLVDGTSSVKHRISNPEKIQDILYTHSHSDHFDREFLAHLAPVRAHIHASWADRVQIEGVTVVPFETMETFTAGDFSVTALPSNHLTENDQEQTVHFVIEKDQKALFYATDGAWLTSREWRGLQAFELDGVIFDATIGDLYSNDYRIFEHNSLDMIRMMLGTMRSPCAAGQKLHGQIHAVLKKEAPVFLTHLARTLYPVNEAETREKLRNEFIVAYDGMEADI